MYRITRPELLKLLFLLHFLFLIKTNASVAANHLKVSYLLPIREIFKPGFHVVHSFTQE
jgi:hypothetical protein